ncbi:MAG: iron ABC transporter permease [Clostridiales bacterium]|jgi:iron(III) transport system permease protein|nr:iron ABC transporter permease [Clostridiales bacterium]
MSSASKRKKQSKAYGPLIPICLILIVLVLLPLGMIFKTAVFPGGSLDASNALATILNPENAHTVGNTLLLGLCVVLCSTAIAMPLALITARTRIAHSKWLDIILMIPFMTPPYIASMGWILFVQKRGLFQQLFPGTGAFSERFISFGGLVLVMSLHVFPFMLTILKNALINIGAGMEESAAIYGGGFWYRLRRVTLPLITGNYAIGALLVFVKTASEYGTPATLGRRIGFNVFVTDIHRAATIAPIDFGKAASLSGVLITICLTAWFLQNYVSTRRSYNLVGGKGSRPAAQTLGGFKLGLACAYVALVLVVSIGIPYFSVISTALINLRGYGLSAGNFTFAHFVELFNENPRGRQAFSNSVFLAVTSASIAAVLGTACAAAVRAAKGRLRKAVEIMGLMPEMLPGIVLVIGIMLFWNMAYKAVPLYNTIWIMVLAYVTLFLPYTIQYVSGAFQQIGDNLAAAGKVLGGRPFYVFRRVTLPLLARGIFAGWMMTFIISFRELVTASLIAPPNTLVISTFIIREFEQGSVSVGMAMAVICVLFTTGALILINRFNKEKPN